ncbi:CRS1 / YhbY (CRM) domain protein [uncultured archaeon]|nr:CRS1 / YhbY (CRM) domain protein [uncultured archaeon]
MATSEMQLGKNGITESFVETLKRYFQNHEIVKISVLKSAREKREDMKKHSEEIINKLGDKYTAKIIGFKIILKKWRKARS